MSFAARALIHTSHIQHNLAVAKRHAPQARVMAVVKANGYGHGLTRVAKALAAADVDGLAVARLDEALLLRRMGWSGPVLLLEGLLRQSDLALAHAERFTLMVHHESQIQALRSHEGQGPMTVWLKADSGMHRLGFSHLEATQRLAELRTLGFGPNSVVLASHLAVADEDDGAAATEQQFERFNSIEADVPRSLANSAGVLRWPESHQDWVRPGIMLYGISPFGDPTGPEVDLKPAMTLETRLIAVNQVPKGERIGYGGSYVAERDMRVGVAAIGYGDGYPRSAENGTPVWVDGHIVPMCGRVSMDMITVDLTDHAHIDVGARVVLWGPELPAEKVAARAGTIAYELVTRLTPRVHFEEQD